jgi:outer membrane biosynthesis protein TonB
MIPRLLVPFNARPPAADVPTARRRPTTLDERTLVPAMLPIVPLNGHSNIPSSLPLESIAARVVVPRDLKREDFAVEEKSHLPLQPTELDERITVPQGAAPPEVITPLENIPTDFVDPDIFMTGEVQLLTTPRAEDRARLDLIRNSSSVAFHLLMLLAIIFIPKIFPPRPKTQEELDLARRQMTILLPPGAFETPRPAPRREPAPPPVKVDPRILRRVAPPEPEPKPAPKEPERVAKELPNAPVPQPNATPPTPETSAPVAKVETPKLPLKLEKPEEQPTQKGLILPKTSPGRSIQDSLREASKMNAPTAIGGGGQIPSRGVPGAGGQGSAYAGIEMLTPTEGVNFNDYLARVYQSVKRNWFAVMPASVELGDKGVVSLQFRIMKNGAVPEGEPVKVFGSGKEPLDRAAVSSIRTSNPFEPLPPAFSGPYIELRFTYYYNLQPDYAH